MISLPFGKGVLNMVRESLTVTVTVIKGLTLDTNTLFCNVYKNVCALMVDVTHLIITANFNFRSLSIHIYLMT